MKKRNQFALYISIAVLVGFPIFFLGISMYTGMWNYFVWSLPPSFTAGFTGLIITLRQMKKNPSTA